MPWTAPLRWLRREGIFTGLDCEINFDTGAYASLCGPVLERACTHAVGPYKYQNTDIRGFGYYTNNPPAARTVALAFASPSLHSRA